MKYLVAVLVMPVWFLFTVASLPWLTLGIGLAVTGHEEDGDRIIMASPMIWLFERWDERA